MQDPTRPADDTPRGHGPPDGREIPLAQDLTHCVLSFVQDRVTPVAQWVAWTGGDPGLVLIVVAETLRAIADGIDVQGVDA